MAKTYNLKRVAVIVGADMLSGFAEDAAVEIAFDEDQWAYTPNADGGGTRSKSNNLAATISIHLSQSSESNSKLQDLWNQDRLGDAGVRPILIKDASGNSLFAAEQCWVQKQPDAAFSKTVGERVWVLRTDELIPQEGGNN